MLRFLGWLLQEIIHEATVCAGNSNIFSYCAWQRRMTSKLYIVQNGNILNKTLCLRPKLKTYVKLLRAKTEALSRYHELGIKLSLSFELEKLEKAWKA